MRPVLLTALALAGALAGAADAQAFCRTTTVRADAGYDPAAGGNGCWSQGQALAWSGDQAIGYSLVSTASAQVSLADATNIARVAFASWGDASCRSGKPNVHAFDQGPVSPEAAATDCGLNSCGSTVHDPQHLIVFRDKDWPHNDKVNTLALTTVTYGKDSGTIFDADIEVNATLPLTTAEPPPAGGGFDLQAILTHEAGHFLGLAHATDMNAIMYAYYHPGATQLTEDDISGICSIYPPDKHGGCATAPGPIGPAGLGLAALTLAGALARRRKGARAAD